MDIDRNILENLPINSDDPMFLAAECFRDTLIEIGVNEESAETARRTFLALKKNTLEKTQNKIRRIASRLSCKSSRSLHNFLPGEEQKGIAASSIIKQNSLDIAASSSKEVIESEQASMIEEKKSIDVANSADDSGHQSAETHIKYNLLDMLPYVPLNPVSEEEVAKMKEIEQKIVHKNKLDASHPKHVNSIILEGPISKFVNRHHNLVKRYIVLNSTCLFVYKDDLAFKRDPSKPQKVMPLREIAGVAQREYPAQQMLKSQNVTSLSANDTVYVMEIALTQGYQNIMSSIDNFQNVSVDGSKGGQKKLVQQPQQKTDFQHADDVGFVFVDIQMKIIQKWVKKVQAALDAILSEGQAPSGLVPKLAFAPPEAAIHFDSVKKEQEQDQCAADEEPQQIQTIN